MILVIVIFYWQINSPVEKYSQKEVVFTVEVGEGLFDIASNLKKQGLIKSQFLFSVVVTLRNVQNQLQAGTYNLLPRMSIVKIVKIISQGETIKQRITIIEGWNLRDIAWELENQGMFQAEELFEIADENTNLEGYLFPDTYDIGNEEKLEDIIKKILKNFDKKISLELKEEMEKQERTLHQVIIMASLLEKEVQTYEDKKVVAGILWKRLRNNWPLQVDASITYLTGKKSLSLTKEELAIDSPYNTYKYPGLPLGPICNPGLDSIEAAIYYEENPYWFYLTTPNQETIFSKTLEEHNININRYLK